jgi:hypothetical protein
MYIDSLTLTLQDAEDLAVILRWAIDHGIGTGHHMPEDPEYRALEKRREALLAVLQRFIGQARRRAGRAKTLKRR